MIILLVLIISLSGEAQTRQASNIYIPDQIMLTINGDPASSRAVSWRTAFHDTISLGQITEATTGPVNEKNVMTVKGKFSPWEPGSSNYMGHKVIFNGLKAKTKYVYRVGNGIEWSEWFQFKTASDIIEPFSFLYLGDFQNDLKSQCSRIIRQAYSHFPDAGFMLFAGDLVNRSFEELWDAYFYTGGWIFGTMPSVPTPGNHEYYPVDTGEPRPFSNHWQQIFTMPENSPSPELNARAYYMDYQGVRFISLDSPGISYKEDVATLVIKWLDEVLTSNPNPWSVVFTHYPVFSCSQGRDNERYRNAVKPILEKHGVDLVLQGHDHTYCRGFNLDQLGENCDNPPLYIVSVAGPKMYNLNPNIWADRIASDTQLYQHITVNGNKIGYKAYTATGELYDAFTLKKNKKGINRFKEDPAIKTINERIDIPEGRSNNYSEEEKDVFRRRKGR